MQKFMKIMFSVLLLSNFCLAKNKGGCLRVGHYKTERCTVNLYDSGMGRYYMECNLFTFVDNTDPISLWFFNNMKKRHDITLCLSERADILHKIITLRPQFSKVLNKNMKKFSTMMNGRIPNQSYDTFFEFKDFHKAPAARHYAYFFYSNSKKLCYKKFVKIFGQEALQPFIDSFPACKFL